MKREFSILKKLNHKNITKLNQIVESDTQYFLVMEHCTGGDLFDYIVDKQKLESDEAARIFL